MLIYIFYHILFHFNSLPASVVGQITFANSLDPDQAGRFVGPDLDPKCLTRWYSKDFLEKIDFAKISG